VDSAQLQVRRAVRDALCEAISRQAWVSIYLQGDPSRNIPVRECAGVPVCFVPGKDGSERVVLSVTAGETEQIVRLERIARVVFRDPE
jgi:hypothetical protein